MSETDQLADILSPARYVIRRRDGVFVAPVGSPCSYVKKLQDARTFSTYADAEREVCPGNEEIVPIEGIFRNRHKHEPGSYSAASEKAKANQPKGTFPRHAYMYVGGMSIANAYKLDRGTVEGCEYLEEYWQLRLLIPKQAETERKLMLAVGAYHLGVKQ